MEYVVERTGKNVEEAISFALEELGIDRENASRSSGRRK